jgi:hypothetical protein
VSDLKPDRQRRDLHKSNLSVTSRKVGPVFIRVVVDAYVYHKYCISRCVNLEIGIRRLVLEGKPLHQVEMPFEGFLRTRFCPKTSIFER